MSVGVVAAIGGASLLPVSAAHAATTSDTAAVIEQALSSRGIPGAQVVHRKGSTISSYEYGVQSVATGVPVAEDTLFQAASLSKVVGSYLFLKRVDAGVIDLDTPLWEYYPSPRIANSPAAQTVTARMVLSHTTGFPNWAGAAGSETTELAPTTVPGSTFTYSGDGFFLLQTVIEQLEGKTFAQILHDEVFVPFGMDDTTLQYRPEDAARTIVGHDAAGTPVAMSTYTRGNTAYTLQTTGLDYTVFLERALIGGEGLTPNTHEQWLTPASNADRDPANAANPFIDWGLGVGLERNELGTAAWHWGDNGTRKAFFLAFPDRDESVVMFWNSANGQRSANDILKAFYGDAQFRAITWVGGYDPAPAPSVPTSDAWPELSSAVQPILDQAAAAGIDIGVAVEDLSGYYDDKTLYLGKQDRFTTASTIKMALAATVMNQVQSGRLDLSDVFTITAAEQVGGSGILKNGPFPQEVTVGRMLELMVTISDNTATNKLVDVVGGFGAINSLTESAGIARGDLHFGRKMFGAIIPPDGDIWLSPYGVNQLMTQFYDIAAGDLVRPDFLSAESAQSILDLMLQQQVKTKLGAVIPADVLAHKTGENADVSHDIGLVLVPGQEVTLSVFSTRQPTFAGDVQATADPYLQRIGTAVYDYLLATAPTAPAPGSPAAPEPGAGTPAPGAGAETQGSDASAGTGALAASGMDPAPTAAALTGAALLIAAGAVTVILVGRRRRAARS